MAAVVKTRMTEMRGVRMHWDYQIHSLNGQELYVTARVTLVAVEREKGKIMRIPPILKDALTRLSAVFSSD